ncbi:MAG TPA: DUF3313 domain-containing protein [Candidatus Binataceae bacterium]|nr:DUF3313 domain-containing protein [Candidatus Binataceae bacterium]
MDYGLFRQRVAAALCVGALATMALMAGCSTTVESKPAAVQAVESGGTLPPDITGFLGADASKLQPGPKGGAALAYVDRNAAWSSYNKILLEPVQFWASADSKVSTADQQVLTTYFYNSLKTNLSKNFTIVDQPGPGVVRLQVALMDATTAVPGLRTISVIVPQARVLNMAQSLATDSYAFVGSAEAELKATDSQTGALLAEAVDKRAGGMGIKSAASFQWGDAQNAMDFWSEAIATRFQQFQQGNFPTATASN